MSFCSYKYKGGDTSMSCYLCSSSKCENGRLRCSSVNSTCFLTADCEDFRINTGYVGLKTLLQRRRICTKTGVEYECDDENDKLLHCSPRYLSGIFQFKFSQSKRDCNALISGDKYNLQDMRCTCETCDCIFCENHDLQCTCDVQLSSLDVSTQSVTLNTSHTTVPTSGYTEQASSTSDASTTNKEWNVTGKTATKDTSTENVTAWNTTSKSLISRDTELLDDTNSRGDVGYIAAGICTSLLIVVLLVVLYLFLRKRRMGAKTKRDSQSSHFDNASYNGFNPQRRCRNLEMPHHSKTKENMYEDATFLTDRSIPQETRDENHYDTIESEALAAASNYDTPTRHYMEMKKPVLSKQKMKPGVQPTGHYTPMGKGAEDVKYVHKQDDAYEYSHCSNSNRELCSDGDLGKGAATFTDEDGENVYQVIDDNAPVKSSKENCDYLKDNINLNTDSCRYVNMRLAKNNADT